MIKLYRTTKGKITENKCQEYVGQFDIRVDFNGLVFEYSPNHNAYICTGQSLQSYITSKEL